MPRSKIDGTNQFQRSCNGHARMSDHTIRNSMATSGINVKVKIDSVSKWRFMLLILIIGECDVVCGVFVNDICPVSAVVLSQRCEWVEIGMVGDLLDISDSDVSCIGIDVDAVQYSLVLPSAGAYRSLLSHRYDAF